MLTLYEQHKTEYLWSTAAAAQRNSHADILNLKINCQWRGFSGCEHGDVTQFFTQEWDLIHSDNNNMYVDMITQTVVFRSACSNDGMWQSTFTQLLYYSTNLKYFYFCFCVIFYFHWTTFQREILYFYSLMTLFDSFSYTYFINSDFCTKTYKVYKIWQSIQVQIKYSLN